MSNNEGNFKLFAPTLVQLYSMLSAVMMSVVYSQLTLFYRYSVCRCAGCHYAGCRGALASEEGGVSCQVGILTLDSLALQSGKVQCPKESATAVTPVSY